MRLSGRKIWKKLSRMSRHEFRTRLGQELGKRAEYGLYRTGLLGQPVIGTEPRDAEAKFLFSEDELPSRVALLQEHLPEVAAAIVGEANEILQHRFRLLGYDKLDYGKEIDWHLDAVHGKRTGLKPWYKVRFLEFAEAGDHKVTWELNRHQHFVTLAKAWTLTGNDEYVQEIQRQFYSWRQANPYPMGINWGSSLEVAFRSLSWLWVRNFLRSSTSAPTSFDRDLVRGLARHGRYIERYLSTYFSPNTHLIGEAVALFFIGTLCPQISASSRWQQKGLQVILREAERQVRPDGVYFEQSLYYHVYALDFFLHARVLAMRNGISLPERFDLTLQKMLNVLQALCLNGAPEGFGDDDGGRVFNPRRNRAEHMSDPLALGACLFDQASVRPSALTEESIWLFGQRAAKAFSERDPAPELSSRAFSDGGLYIISSDGANRGQMLVDAGPHGIGHGGHGHADALSLRLSLNGQRWLIDPGAYVYIFPVDERNQFRGTAAHNTLRVDELDQAIPESAFSWRSLPDVSAQHWQAGSGFTFFSGSQNGYRRLPDPVLHRRMIFHLHGEYWIVRDVVEGRAAHDLELFWHFAPGIEVELTPGCVHANADGQQLAILDAAPSTWQGSIEDGWVSPAYGEKVSGAVACFHSRVQLPAEHATLLLPVNALRSPGQFRFDSSVCGATMYVFEQDHQTDQMIFGSNGESWEISQIRSDAAFLFLRKEREVTHLAFSSATFVEVDGSRVFSSPTPIERLEWTAAAGATASDPEALRLFKHEAFPTKTPVI